LVSDGQRNGIQYWRCQACGGRKTSRLDTPMYRLKTPLQHVVMVMTALSEGVDISAASRIFGYHPTTIQRWLERGGGHGERLHERALFRAVVAGHIQLDELVTRVKRDHERVWLWSAIDAASKLIVAAHLGRRSTADACELIHQVCQRLKPGCFPVYTSDGLNQYHYGLTAHFGYWDKPPRARKYHWFADDRLQYAQLRKRRQGRQVTFLYSIIRLGVRDVIRTTLQKLGFTGTVQTAYIERSNLTLREHVAPLSRRTWSLAHDRHHLWLHIQWGLTYYHFVRPHQSLAVRIRSPGQPRYRTPAMAAGLTRKRWTVAELLMMPVPEYGVLAPFPII
jgi:IS1 family transposase